MPGLSIGGSVAGFGLRVGTRGVGLRTPLGGVKVGSSGFRTTVGVPGVAHLSVAPLKPAATLGLGPLRLRAAKHPGIGISTSLVSVGVTTAPLIWTRVGAFRWGVAGKIQRSDSHWYDDLNDQWRPHYKRRPLHISGELHSIIRDVEAAQAARAFTPVDIPSPDVIEPATLSAAARRTDLRSRRRSLRRATPPLALRRRRNTRQQALVDHQSWVAQELARLDIEHREAQRLVDEAWQGWRSGDPVTAVLVANAAFAALDAAAVVVEYDGMQATVLVISHAAAEVCPDRPDVTKNGSPTVKKRNKAQLADAIAEAMAGEAVLALRLTRSALRTVGDVRVLIVDHKSAASSLAKARVVATFTHRSSDALPTDRGAMRAFAQQWQAANGTTVRHACPDAFLPAVENESVATDLSALGDAGKPQFWVDVSVAAAHLRRSGPAAPHQSIAPSVRPAAGGRPTLSSNGRPTAPASANPTPAAASSRPRIAAKPPQSP